MFSPVIKVFRLRTQLSSWIASMAMAMVMIQHSATRIDEELVRPH